MASCEAKLWKLVGEIEPTQTQKNGASRSHLYLREILRTGNFANRIVNDYLSGSYARGTAIRPIDDVDVIFVIDPRAWPGIYFLGPPAPDVILESFAAAIRYRYAVSSVFGQRRSVRLELNHLDIDVVPAIHEDLAGDVILIPDRDSGEWIKSSPKRHAAKASEINGFQNHRFKPLVKILKYWNGNLASTAKLKSFAIESMAARAFERAFINSLEEGLLLFFDLVVSLGGGKTHFSWRDSYGMSLSWWGSNLPDLADTGTNIFARLEDARRLKFLEAARISRDRMLDAKTARSVDVAISKIQAALRA